MERLTYFSGGRWWINLNGDEYSGFPEIDRLAAYEDFMERWRLRNLEEAGRIFQRVNALGGTDLMAQYRDLGSIDHLKDLVQAEKDGRLAVLPFVAMVEQSLQNGKMTPKQDQRFNGRYAVVYVDKKKWASPLIDICGRHYDREETEKRLSELTREEAGAALKKREADNEAVQ